MSQVVLDIESIENKILKELKVGKTVGVQSIFIESVGSV